jgi:NACalpha-BTF3-like transcription factor
MEYEIEKLVNKIESLKMFEVIPNRAAKDYFNSSITITYTQSSVNNIESDSKDNKENKERETKEEEKIDEEDIEVLMKELFSNTSKDSSKKTATTVSNFGKFEEL